MIEVVQKPKIGTLYIKKHNDVFLPNNCIDADGKWYSREFHPDLYTIFKECKCHDNSPNPEESRKERFHVPNSHGKAWIIYK